MINANNRPVVVIPLGIITESAVMPVLVADKKMRIRSAKVVQEGAISASGVNYLTMQMKVDNVAVQVAVDTQAGVPARTPVQLLSENLVLEKDEYLALDIAETGAFAEGTDMILVLDVEVIGH